ATLYQPRRSPRPTLFPYTTLFRSYPPPPPGHRAFGQNAHALASGRRALSGNRPAEGTRESGAELRSDVEAELHHVPVGHDVVLRSEEHTSELQSRENLVCRLLLEK